MASNKQIINSFLNNNYDDKDTLGVLFYGSRRYETHRKDSDIDLLILSNEAHNYKGVNTIDGIKVEYFQKNFYYVLSMLDGIEFSLDRSLVSMFKNGDIIFSKNNSLELLRDDILCRNDLSRRNKIENDYNIYSWLNTFYDLNDNLFKEYIYHNLIESIRRTYHIQNGYSKMPSNKSIDLYKNRDYAKRYYCLNLPDKNFTDAYLDMIDNPNIKKINEMLSHISYDRDDKYQVKIINNHIINYRSTVIYSNLLKLYTLKKQSSYIHYYYLILEKIRSLFCDINSINGNISKFKDINDEYFLKLFHGCLMNKNIDSISLLFNYVTGSLKIDYSNYKILDLKKN